VRGLAILAVIVFHVLGEAPYASGLDRLVVQEAGFGWMGVDLFFVLSGFLITGILIEARGSASYFRAFFARRILRIVPAYVAFLGFSMWIAPSVGVWAPAHAHALRALQWWYWTYSVNIYTALHGWSDWMPIHLWSLGVEEQFYLMWPFVVAVCAPSQLFRITSLCFIAASVSRVVMLVAGAHPLWNYVLLPSRMDTLAAGAFLACAVRDAAIVRRLARWRRVVLAAAIVLLAVGLVQTQALPGVSPRTQLFAFPAIAVLAALLVSAVWKSRTLLTARPLRFLGRYSYALYLWHLLARDFVAAHTDWLHPHPHASTYLPYYALSVSAVLALSVGVALVSWHLVEQPFLRLKQFVPHANVRAAPVAISIVATN
jgi:peptidoglycan/LPS O-acetylase OafA/YrhL